MAGEALRVVEPGAVAPLKRADKAPHSVQAEQALLGAILVNNRTYDALEGVLHAEHFYVPMHGAVFEAMEEIINGRGGEANPITVAERLRGTPFDADKALFPHLSSMFENAGLAGDARSLADVIITAFRQRQLMGLAENLHTQARAVAKPEDVEAMLEAVGSEVFRLSDMGGRKSTVRDMREHLIGVMRHAEEARSSGTCLTGVASGFYDLDKLLSGFQKSDLIILGARPSMGKTSLLLNIAQAAATRHLKGEANGAPVGFFSLEMNAEQLTQRILSRAADVDARRLANGQLADAEMVRVAMAAGELHKLPLHIDDTAGLSISALRSRARQMKRQYGIGLMIVDYLQLLTCPLKGDFNRVQEISQITQGLKHVARELDVPVIAASQLSRQVESRDDKRPQLSDLRESGSIEQDADVVMFVYREEYYHQMRKPLESNREKFAEWMAEADKVHGKAEVIIGKQRHGPTGTVELQFDAAVTRFASLARDDHVPERL